MDYTYPRPKPLSLESLVPGTSFTARQITRMATAFRAPQVGMICSRDGAWDHKYVITDVALVKGEKDIVIVGGSARLVQVNVYEIEVLNLGKFNSDLRIRPASRYSPAKHKVLFATDTWEQVRSRGSMRLGIPIGDVADPTISDRVVEVGVHDLNEAAKLYGEGQFYELEPEVRFKLAAQFKAQKEQQWADSHALWLAQKEAEAGGVQVNINSGPKPKTPKTPKTPEAILADYLI